MTLKQTTMYSPLGACELQSVLRALDESTIVAVTDASWNITYVNDRFCQVSGYSREELIGQNHRILKSGEHPTEFWVEMYQDLSFGKTWTGTVKNIAKDGSNYWVDSVFTPILGDDGNLCGAIALRYETTILHTTVNELVESNQRAQFAMKGCVEGLYRYESSTDKLWFSERFHELLDIPSESLGTDFATFLALLHPVDRRKWTDMSLENLFKHGDWETEFRLRNQSGSYIWFRLVSKRFTSETASDWSVAGSISNIQTLKQREHMITESRLAAEKASRVKMEFLTNMSHEIRTPMTAILGYLDLIDEQPANQEQSVGTGEVVDIIRRNAKHLLSLINDILDVSKIESGKMKIELVKVDLREITPEVVSFLMPKANDKGIDLDCEFVGSIPEWIMTDPTRLRQILINLVGNAIKFTNQGGVKVKVAFDPETGLLSLCVEDSGIGMTKEQCDAIAQFDAFSQADSSTSRKFGGTGLGLHISHLLTGMLGGGLDIDSQVGKGSRFTATVHADEFEFAESVFSTQSSMGLVARCDPTNSSQEPSLPLCGLRILLAEDSPDIQRLFTLHLMKAGAEVVTVENGIDALSTVLIEQEHWFDLILMDMQMPKMDGYEATKELRIKGCDTPILAVTAHATAGARHKCLQAGCNDFMTKPVNKTDLIEMCRSYALGLDSWPKAG